MSIDKIKQFVSDHKKELIATTVVVGGAVLVILGCKRRTKKHATGKSNMFRMGSRLGTRRIFGRKVVT